MASNSSEFRQLLQRYQQGECSPEEVRRIEAWYGQLGAEQPFDLTSREREALTAAVWQRIADRTTGSRKRRPELTGWASWPTSVRAAAIAAGVLGAGVFGIQLSHRPLRTAITRQRPATTPAPATWLVYTAPATAPERRVALPDGSFVTLAPGATLRYQRAKPTGRRITYLKGEAFFDVFHDEQHPFSVLTDQVVSTVLGTSFRVRAVAGQPDVQVQVQVRTGAVRVSPRTGLAGAAPTAGIVVRPNQQAVYSATRRQLWRELVAEPVQLVPQSFVFNDRPVAEVLESLSAAYGVEISYDAGALRNCTLNLSLGGGPLFDKLNLVCEALGSRYETADGRIVFHGQPCAAE